MGRVRAAHFVVLHALVGPSCGLHASLKGQQFEKVVPVWNDGVLYKVIGNPLFNLFAAQLIGLGASRPLPSRMHGVPWGSLVSARRRTVSVLANTEANLNFLVPDRAKQPDHEVFDCRLHAGLDRRGSVVEVRQRQIGSRYALGMLLKPEIERLTLFLDGFSLRVHRVCFPNIDWGFAARQRAVCHLILAVIVDSVDS